MQILKHAINFYENILQNAKKQTHELAIINPTNKLKRHKPENERINPHTTLVTKRGKSTALHPQPSLFSFLY